MIRFRTEIEIPPSDFKISHRSGGLMIGSCFSEYIGELLVDHKFDVDINPTGIVYNPLSVSTCIHALLQEKKYTINDLYLTKGRYVSFDHHGEFSDADPDKCLNRINSRISEASARLKKADYMIITFGTAWIYRLADSGKVVSNNHKLPSRHFSRELLKAGNIADHYRQLIADIRKINSKLHFIFTVSPVRHWKDGASLNMVSKSTLILAIHEIIRRSDFAEYFPAFEIAMDDLRDYRYYSDDLIHPNSQMTSYIWNKFSGTYFEPDTVNLVGKLGNIIKALDHKPVYPGSDEHKLFVNKQLKLINQLQKDHSYLDFNPEKDHFENQLS